MTPELAALKSEMDASFAKFDRIVEDLRLSLQERDAAIARQREVIRRQARLIGGTPASQLHLHGGPLRSGPRRPAGDGGRSG